MKSRRLLARRGVTGALAEGRALALSGRPRLIEKRDGERITASLAFYLDAAQEKIYVGYAVERGGRWSVEEGEFEPFTQRALGYYRRFLERRRTRSEGEPG